MAQTVKTEIVPETVPVIAQPTTAPRISPSTVTMIAQRK